MRTDPRKPGTPATTHFHDLAEVDAAIAALEGRIDAELDALDARVSALEGEPQPEPEPEPEPTVTQTIVDGSTIKGVVDWLATFENVFPTRVEMLIDGIVKWTEYGAPWGDTGPLDTTTLANAAHEFTVKGYDATGLLLVASSVTATVLNDVVITPPPPTGKVVNVAGVVDLLDALADNSVSEIVMKNGRYEHDPAGTKRETSLYIDRRFAGRTKPILIRPETPGGVIFDGAKATYYGGITINDGAHDQTWRGFRWINGEPTGTGVLVIGGYTNLPPTKNIKIEDCEASDFYGRDTGTQGHGIYISQAFGGPHTGLVLDNFRVTDRNGVCGGGIHFYHDSYAGGDPPNHFNAHDTIIRGAVLTGMHVGFYVWARTIKNLLIEDCRVIDAINGVRYELGEDITFRRVITTGSKESGFCPTHYMPGGPYRYPTIPEMGPDGVPGPKLVTFEDCDFR